MPHAVDAVFQEELRRAGLPSRGVLAHLLTLLRESPETHLGLSEVSELAAEAGLAVTAGDMARHLEALADHGLIGRLPTTTADLIFDTVPEPHSHIVYEDSSQIVDLHVSAETLLLMVREALAQHPEGVDVILRFRRFGAAPQDS
ncbi:transcriptional repressor [Caulobacter sp. 1776]|uniref:transcriptional repressor n=1 Tax=Caulobacter sp. 1776 TaxID=3156420 RepID=UPI003394A61D